MEIGELAELTHEWRDEADVYERDGGLAPGHALLRRVATQLENRLRSWWTASLTPAEAAKECSWKAETIRRRIGNELPQAGEKYSPRVRRCDLRAVLAGQGISPRREREGPDAAAEVLQRAE